MSCYNWEEGSVKFPTSEWAPFRTAIIEKGIVYMMHGRALSSEACLFDRIGVASLIKRATRREPWSA
jgi:hypothetical protein